ncbi:MAG: MlaD family protein [Vicinamibacterales bacterium]
MQRGTPLVWVGAFVVAGLLLFGTGLFLIGDRRLLFTGRYDLETSLTNVIGLQVGTLVRVAGMRAGEVVSIDVPLQPSQPFVVRLRIAERLAHLVRTDSIASVLTDGLVGNAFIQITPGSDVATPILAGGRIRGVDLVQFSDVIDQASTTLRSFNGLVDEISPQVSATLNTLNETVGGVNRLVDDSASTVRQVSASVSRSLDTTNRMLDDVGVIVTDVKGGRGTIGRLLTDDTLFRQMQTATSHAATTMDQVQATSTQIRQSIDRLLRQGGAVDSLLVDAGGAAAGAEEVIADLAETTEALKRNWLIRGFFRDRGYFDIDAFTPLEYRQFASDERRRSARRIWLDAAVLFTKDGAGNESLSDEGRRRLDLAMGTFLNYRRDGPLIVEGYSSGPTTEEQFLMSDQRARLVRDHLTRRFRRDASVTGALGLGADASNNPAGTGQWDGVALALFLEP